MGKIIYGEEAKEELRERGIYREIFGEEQVAKEELQ